MGVIRNKYSGDTINGNLVPEVVVTDTEVVKEGSIYTPRFNGSTSLIDCGDYNDLSGDFSIIAWIRPKSVGEAVNGYIVTNGKFYFACASVGRLQFTSDVATYYTSSNNAAPYNEWTSVILTRAADGTLNVYINGESYAVDQDSGTPAAGTTDIGVGNNIAGSRAFDGELAEVKVIEGLLTASEISQYFSATKHLYNK